MKRRESCVLCLRSESRIVSGKVIDYKLFCVRKMSARSFAVSISDGEESEMCDFGANRLRAFEMYGKIVRNEVTPCTLCDIAQDFAEER